MNQPSEQQISNINLGRMSARDHRILAGVRPGTPEVSILIEKVQAVFERLRERGIKDDFDVAMLGVELHSSLSHSSWNDLCKAILEEFGPEAERLLSLRVQSTEHDTVPEGASPQDSVWEARKKFHHLREQIALEDRVSPHSKSLVAASKELQQFSPEVISREGFVADFVLALAEVNRRRTLPAEMIEVEKIAKAYVTHELSRLLIQEAPEERVGWAYLALAYEQEEAFAEAEIVRFHNVQAFDTMRDWEECLVLLGRLEGRANDSRNVGAEALLRYPDSFSIIANVMRAALRLNELERDLPILLELSTRILFIEPPREDLRPWQTQYFMSINILALDLGKDISKSIHDGSVLFIETYLGTQSADQLRWIARNFRNGAVFLKMVLTSVRSSAPNLWSAEFDDILTFSHTFGSIDDQVYARKAGYEAIETENDVVATRRWLAQLITRVDGEDAIDEAVRLLKENIQKYEDEASRVLLRQLENVEMDKFLDGIESKGLDADPVRLKGVGRQNLATKLIAGSAFSSTSYPLAQEIREIGALKKIELCQSEAGSLLDTLKSIKPETVQAKAQMEIIEARYGDLEKMQEPGSFAAKFEYALRIGDIELLNRIRSSVPNLLAVSIVAKSLFGDREATQDLLTFFSDEEDLLPADQLLIHRLKKRLSLIDAKGTSDPVRLGEVLQMERVACVALLRNANEAHALRAA